MEKYFSKKLIFLLTIIASAVIVLISSVQFYYEYEEYNTQSENEIKSRVERIASAVVPSVWELYQKSVERKFSDDFSSKVLDSEIRNEGIDAIVIRGQFGHFYMGRYKSGNEENGIEVRSFKDLNDYQKKFKNNIYSFPIKNGTMTIGAVEVVRDDRIFKSEFSRKILINVVETIIITISFFLITFYGVSRSLLKPLQEISLATKTINILNEGILFLNEDFSIKECNLPVLNMLNKPKKEILGRNGVELFGIDLLSFMKDIELKEFVETESKIIIDQVEKYFQIYIVKIFDDQNQFLNYALKFQDVSDIKRMVHSLEEAKLIAENANSRKSTFLANMSHEIRTPLNSICGLSEYISDNKDIDENELLESLKSINVSSTHLLSVINNIIDFSKIEDSKVIIENHLFSLDEKVSEVINTFKHQANDKDLNLSFVNNLSNKLFIGDSYRVIQVLNNLLSNAFKFTSTGEIKVQLSSTECKDGIEHVLIEVIDNGIGVTKESQKNLFVPYLQADESTTRKFGGTGLGLSISKEIALLLKGDLKYRDNPEGGSIFSFEVPLMISTNSNDTKIEEKEDLLPVFNNLKVLIVDDEKLNRNLLRLYFKKDKNVETQMAINGEEGFEVFKSIRPDVVLLDLHMPVMDGHECLKRMRQFEKDNNLSPATIIVISANTLSESSVTLMENGADSYLIKPISVKKLKNELSKLIG